MLKQCIEPNCRLRSWKGQLVFIYANQIIIWERNLYKSSIYILQKEQFNNISSPHACNSVGIQWCVCAKWYDYQSTIYSRIKNKWFDESKYGQRHSPRSQDCLRTRCTNHNVLHCLRNSFVIISRENNHIELQSKPQKQCRKKLKAEY